jgi:tRNA1(Val) A37 N6-methylase TrmN6
MPDLREIKFPSLDEYIQEDEYIDIVTKFSKTPIEITSDPAQKVIAHINIDYEKEKDFLRLSDFFTQEARMRSSFLGKITPYDFFTTNRAKIIRDIGYSPTYDSVYSYIWNNSSMCSNFPTLVVKKALEIYKPQNVFDPCAGWGDRMITCASHNVSYTGVDPNKMLIPGYSKMISMLDLDTDNYRLISQPIEEFDHTSISPVDMVFTSPPFFDMERYTKSRNQSYLRYRDYDEWRKNFLELMLDVSIDVLKKEGILALYVNNIRRYNILNDTLFYLKNKKTVEYEGKITWDNTKYTKTMMIFKRHI